MRARRKFLNFVNAIAGDRVSNMNKPVHLMLSTGVALNKQADDRSEKGQLMLQKQRTDSSDRSGFFNDAGYIK